MLKSEQFIRDTFSEDSGRYGKFFFDGIISMVSTKIGKEYTGDPNDGKNCIEAKYEGIIFGPPYIDLVFDDRYHAKSVVRDRFYRNIAKLDGVNDFKLNKKDDSISFKDNSNNEYTLFPCAYSRKTVAYFDDNGEMCVVYFEGNFELDKDTKSKFGKDLEFNMKNLLEKLKENGGVTFNSGKLKITNDNLDPVDLEYVKDTLSKSNAGYLIHSKFGGVIKYVNVVIDKYHKGAVCVTDVQSKNLTKAYYYYPIGRFEGLTVFATADINYFKISCMMVNLEEDRPDFLLSDNNFVSPFYEFTIEQDSDWVLGKLSDPFLKDYIREEFDYRDRMDAFIYYLRYLVTKEDHDNWITISDEAESFFEGDGEVEYLKNGFYGYLYDKFIGENSVFSELNNSDRLKWLREYKFVTIYGNEVELKDYQYSNVPCFKIYKG